MDKALHVLRDQGVGDEGMVQKFQTLLEEVPLALQTLHLYKVQWFQRRLYHCSSLHCCCLVKVLPTSISYISAVLQVQLLRSALQAAPAAIGDAASDWQVAAQTMCISERELTELYENALKRLSFGTIELLAHHSFQSSAAAQPVDPR